MDYKKIIKSRETRFKILNLLSWIPDRIMIPLQYRIHTGRYLKLRNPKRFTEKIQIYKMKYHNPIMLRCTDKYEVRSFVEEMGLSSILVPLIGIYDNAENIDFPSLPDSFVAKTTDGGGSLNVLVCADKKSLTSDDFYSTVNNWLSLPKYNYKTGGREWAYNNGYKRRIIIEEYLSDGINKDLVDYKFYCFHGVPTYCQVIGTRSSEETIDFYDMEWNRLPFVGLNPKCRNAQTPFPRPLNFEKMVESASKLARDFPYVRVDLYNVKGKIYFGELTFYPASGMGDFFPDKYDEIVGSHFNI